VFPNERPVGAGPYKFVSFSPTASLILERSDTYFDKANIRIKTVEIDHVTSASAVNAIQSQQIDFLQLLYSQATQVKGGGITLEYENNDENTGLIYMVCKKFPGLSDVRVRQAISLAVDRQAISDAVYDGKASVLDTMFGSGHALFNPKLKGTNKRDVAQAKKLLAEAGYANGFDLTFVQAAAGPVSRPVEIMQAQLKEAGINVKIEQSANFVQDFYINRLKPASVTDGVSWSGLDRLTVNLVAKGIGNLCQVGEPGPDGTAPSADEQEMQSIIVKLRSLDPTSKDAKDLWFRAEELDAKNLWQIWTVSPPISRAYAGKVGGASVIPMWAGLAPDIRTMFIKKGA
jgi:ABC-type transport system substrate-binding protein